MVPNLPGKGFNSLVVLVAWWICKHWNQQWLYFLGVFFPNLTAILRDIRDEAKLWCIEGAKGLQSIWP
jgi:hypothetical protein